MKGKLSGEIKEWASSRNYDHYLKLALCSVVLLTPLLGGIEAE
jgi:hypothetical protein